MLHYHISMMLHVNIFIQLQDALPYTREKILHESGHHAQSARMPLTFCRYVGPLFEATLTMDKSDIFLLQF